MTKWQYTKGLHDLGNGCFAYLQPDGGWGWSNAGLIADERHAAGLLCLGYPFHPVGKPAQLRTAHLAQLKTPTLIVQGTRDPFGTREEVAGYKLAKAIEILWLEDGDHDLRPRKAVSGFSMADHLKTMAEATAVWAAKIT